MRLLQTLAGYLELDQLRDVIEKEFSEFVRALPADESLVDAFANTLRRRIARVGEGLTDMIMTRVDARDYTASVRDIQQEVFGHMEYLLPYLKSESAVVVILAQHVRTSLNDMLQLIRLKYPTHFDAKVWLSLDFIEVVGLDLAFQFGKLPVELKESGVPEELIDIVLMPMAQINRGERKVMNYHDALYLEKVLRGIRHILCTRPNEVEHALHSMLLEMNFNSQEYYVYYTSRMHAEIRGKSTIVKDQLHELAIRKKQLKQTVVTSGMQLIADKPKLIASLIGWINAECECIKEIHSGDEITLLSGNEPAPETSDDADGFILETSLTIEAFCYLVIVFEQIGVISKINKTKFAEAITRYVKTSTRGKIGKTTVRQLFYQKSERPRLKASHVFDMCKEFVRTDDGRNDR